MNKTSPSSTEKPTPPAPLWEKLEAEFLERVRASGRTVTVLEPSDTTEFVASFPQGRPPAAKQPDDLPST